MEFTKYGISSVPNTEPAQDNVNRPFGVWHDLVNKVISHEPNVTDPWNFGELYKKFKSSYSKNQISSFKNRGDRAQNLPGGGIPPMCRRGLRGSPIRQSHQGLQWRLQPDHWHCSPSAYHPIALQLSLLAEKASFPTKQTKQTKPTHSAQCTEHSWNWPKDLIIVGMLSFKYVAQMYVRKHSYANVLTYVSDKVCQKYIRTQRFGCKENTHNYLVYKICMPKLL